MLEIRKDARGLVERLLGGEAFTITYRNREVGVLRPLPREAEDLKGDPVYELADQAEDLGDASISSTEADELIYGRRA